MGFTFSRKGSYSERHLLRSVQKVDIYAFTIVHFHTKMLWQLIATQLSFEWKLTYIRPVDFGQHHNALVSVTDDKMENISKITKFPCPTMCCHPIVSMVIQMTKIIPWSLWRHGNGNTQRVTSPLWGESTGPHRTPAMCNFNDFLLLTRISCWTNSTWFETLCDAHVTSHWYGTAVRQATAMDEIKLVHASSILGPFSQYRLTLIPAWISNHIPNKVWDEITYSSPNLNGCTVEVWWWICNLFPTLYDAGIKVKPCYKSGP